MIKQLSPCNTEGVIDSWDNILFIHSSLGVQHKSGLVSQPVGIGIFQSGLLIPSRVTSNENRITPATFRYPVSFERSGYHLFASSRGPPNCHVTPGIICCRLYVRNSSIPVRNPVPHLIIFETPIFKMPLIQSHGKITSLHPGDRGHAISNIRVSGAAVRVTKPRTLCSIFQVRTDILVRGCIDKEHTNSISYANFFRIRVHHDILEFNQQPVLRGKNIFRQVKRPDLFLPSCQLQPPLVQNRPVYSLIIPISRSPGSPGFIRTGEGYFIQISIQK